MENFIFSNIDTAVVTLITVVAGIRVSMGGIARTLAAQSDKLDKIDNRLFEQGNRLTKAETELALLQRKGIL